MNRTRKKCQIGARIGKKYIGQTRRKTITSLLITRTASVSDASALLSIYTPHVEKTAVTLEYTVSNPEEFQTRVAHTLDRYPYLVVKRNREIIGYAYAPAPKERAAHDWAVEISVYVSENTRGTGAGTTLYKALERALEKQNVLNVSACISHPNPGSISFHEKLGYKTAGHFTRCGYKLDQWWDMIWTEKMLGEHPISPSPFTPFSKL